MCVCVCVCVCARARACAVYGSRVQMDGKNQHFKCQAIKQSGCSDGRSVLNSTTRDGKDITNTSHEREHAPGYARVRAHLRARAHPPPPPHTLIG